MLKKYRFASTWLASMLWHSSVAQGFESGAFDSFWSFNLKLDCENYHKLFYGMQRNAYCLVWLIFSFFIGFFRFRGWLIVLNQVYFINHVVVVIKLYK